jgi:leucine-rich repeat protein SHOC2
LLSRSNDLDAVPEAIGALRDLEGLGLTHNRLSQLPESIAELARLQALNVAFNDLTTLFTDFSKLT